MPKAPALVGKLAETLMGRRARVLRTERIAPDFLELEFRADPPAGGWQPGHEVQVRATPTQGRRYNVRTVDAPDRITVLAVLHGDGPGARWLQSLHPGTETTLLASRYVSMRLTGTHRLLIGDGSALGTLDAYATAGRHPSTVVIEAPSASVDRLRGRWPHYRFVPAFADDPGAMTRAWLDETLRREDLADVDGALLLGHAQSIQGQRQALVGAAILDRNAITTRPYWATGKTGL
ncbi:hypothetical protein KGQ19_08610 [Catenulispora sp. NL8]|uniref:FAD-binding FR-type domain-containing protein n=1 Tax=Catenulispora pinistramenti TaxID=2705254 RepID=A0ABS5KLK8_9ACTN|nr:MULTISPECIES: hypothetical protein [Catenulispora]MBS2546931.1 hypothetical protein [Catenulispora pinistramenti]